MVKSLFLKVPVIMAIVALVALSHGSIAWWAALGMIAAGSALLLLLVFDVNWRFWCETLWRAHTPAETVALTFDDGPDAEFTPRVLAVLEAKRVPAAFFVIGEHARAHPDLVARIDRAGHLVANHFPIDTGCRSHFKLWGWPSSRAFGMQLRD